MEVLGLDYDDIFLRVLREELPDGGESFRVVEVNYGVLVFDIRLGFDSLCVHNLASVEGSRRETSGDLGFVFCKRCAAGLSRLQLIF